MQTARRLKARPMISSQLDTREAALGKYSLLRLIQIWSIVLPSRDFHEYNR